MKRLIPGVLGGLLPPYAESPECVEGYVRRHIGPSAYPHGFTPAVPESLLPSIVTEPAYYTLDATLRGERLRLMPAPNVHALRTVRTSMPGGDGTDQVLGQVLVGHYHEPVLRARPPREVYVAASWGTRGVSLVALALYGVLHGLEARQQVRLSGLWQDTINGHRT